MTNPANVPDPAYAGSAALRRASSEVVNDTLQVVGLRSLPIAPQRSEHCS